MGIPIPFPCLPQPLPRKISVVFFGPSDNIDSGGGGVGGGGVRGFTVLKRNEIRNELNV